MYVFINVCIFVRIYICMYARMVKYVLESMNV